MLAPAARQHLLSLRTSSVSEYAGHPMPSSPRSAGPLSALPTEEALFASFTGAQIPMPVRRATSPKTRRPATASLYGAAGPVGSAANGGSRARSDSSVPRVLSFRWADAQFELPDPALLGEEREGWLEFQPDGGLPKLLGLVKSVAPPKLRPVPRSDLGRTQGSQKLAPGKAAQYLAQLKAEADAVRTDNELEQQRYERERQITERIVFDDPKSWLPMTAFCAPGTAVVHAQIRWKLQLGTQWSNSKTQLERAGEVLPITIAPWQWSPWCGGTRLQSAHVSAAAKRPTRSPCVLRSQSAAVRRCGARHLPER